MERHEMSRAERKARAAEFGKLIMKLRWIGAEDEADQLEETLMKIAPRGFVIPPCGETD
jgi:hypothetical protein